MGKNDAIIMICCMMSVWRWSRGGGKKLLGGACNSGSIWVLGCLETPPAFLEAVPSAWTVTHGCL